MLWPCTLTTCDNLKNHSYRFLILVVRHTQTSLPTKNAHRMCFWFLWAHRSLTHSKQDCCLYNFNKKLFMKSLTHCLLRLHGSVITQTCEIFPMPLYSDKSHSGISLVASHFWSYKFEGLWYQTPSPHVSWVELGHKTTMLKWLPKVYFVVPWGVIVRGSLSLPSWLPQLTPRTVMLYL